jgi:hypothetical protein
MRIREPGWENFGSGMEGSGIRDKHPGSATLLKFWNNPRGKIDDVFCGNLMTIMTGKVAGAIYLAGIVDR